MIKAASKIYVGCALSQAPEEFRNSIEAFKDSLRANGHEVHDFIGLVNGTATDVYNWDIGECVANCSAFIAICDYPSIGLGMELDRALMLEKPILAVAHQDTQITRLLIGAAEVEDHVQFRRYQDLAADVPAMVDELVANSKTT